MERVLPLPGFRRSIIEFFERFRFFFFSFLFFSFLSGNDFLERREISGARVNSFPLFSSDRIRITSRSCHLSFFKNSRDERSERFLCNNFKRYGEKRLLFAFLGKSIVEASEIICAPLGRTVHLTKRAKNGSKDLNLEILI